MKLKKPVKTPRKRVVVDKIPNPVYNLTHEDVRHKIEVAFKSGNKKYYRFIDDHQIPAGRYKYIYAALKEADLRMDLETLKNYVDEIKKVLNGGDKKDNVSMESLWRVTINLESRISLAFEPASIERLAAIIYFDETEELKTFNKKHGEDKINFWKKNGTLDFFLTKPIAELFGLSSISTTSLEEYIQDSQQIIEDLTLDLQTVSSESSSENGKKVS